MCRYGTITRHNPVTRIKDFTIFTLILAIIGGTIIGIYNMNKH